MRGYLIRDNADLLSAYRVARAAFPSAALELQELVESDPPQRRLAELIRFHAQSYVNDYADLRARAREHGVSAGRAFASANDGAPRADELEALIERLGAAERSLSAGLAREADEASDRALLIAGLGISLWRWRWRTSRAGS